MRYRHLHLIALAASAVGCVSPNDSDSIESQQEALYQTSSWLNGIVNVCLSIPEWNVASDVPSTPINEAEADRERRRSHFQAIRGLVENVFSRYADIHFRGWQSCSGAATEVAVTLYDLNGPGCDASKCWGRSGYHFIDLVLPAGAMTVEDSVTIQHEFLHQLGFAHEFVSPGFQEPLSWWDGTRWWSMQGYCVAANNPTAGGGLTLTAGGNCHFGNNNIRWTFTPLNSERTLMQIRKTFTDLCVQVPPGGGHGSALNLGTCNASEPRQIIDMTTLPRYKIGGVCFNVYGGTPYEGATVGLWACTGALSPNEVFINGGMLGACVTDAECDGGLGGKCSNGRCREPNGIQRTQPDPQSMTAAAGGYANNEAYFSGRLSPFDVVGLQASYGRIAPGSLVGPGGRCLSVDSGQPWVGGRLVGNECQGTAQDRWSIFTSVDLLRNDFNGQTRCANVSGGVTSPTSFTSLISWGCSSNHTNSMFHMRNTQWLGMGNMCVEATSAAAGGQIFIQVCNETKALQRWNFFENGDMIQLAGTNLCLELPGGSVYYGAPPTLAPCTGSGQQHFGFLNGEINYGGLCFNVLGGQPNPGAGIGLWDGCQVGHFNEYFWIRGPVKALDQCMAFIGDDLGGGVPVGVHACANDPAKEDWDYHW